MHPICNIIFCTSLNPGFLFLKLKFLWHKKIARYFYPEKIILAISTFSWAVVKNLEKNQRPSSFSRVWAELVFALRASSLSTLLFLAQQKDQQR